MTPFRRFRTRLSISCRALLLDTRGSSELTVPILMGAAGTATVAVMIPTMMSSGTTAANTMQTQATALQQGATGGGSAGSLSSGLGSSGSGWNISVGSGGVKVSGGGISGSFGSGGASVSVGGASGSSGGSGVSVSGSGGSGGSSSGGSTQVVNSAGSTVDSTHQALVASQALNSLPSL